MVEQHEEEQECGVCYQAYTRWERVPRRLNCRHTFCTPCLLRMCQPLSSLLSVRCPYCRWTTCMAPGLSLQEALWVNSKLWDTISESGEDEEEDHEGVVGERGGEREGEEKMPGRAQLTAQPKRPSLERYRLHLEVPAILRNTCSRLQRTITPARQRPSLERHRFQLEVPAVLRNTCSRLQRSIAPARPR
ncbi:hypothetical protein JZ751_013740 [Albula glossodonta]|uniref:RING-type domain-containing protein n=1 Tax=Albula glossodonta TaxID=121402 RepID=A0A8T2NWU1_9TELE|nr:hypothetical protein JZ751_013740 [Albula glossodonta]